ncbi:hypothetical protein [Sphingomonas oryzagri]
MRAGCGTDAAGRIVEAVGEEAAALLIDHFGGTSLYVPRRLGDDHPICLALGRQNAEKVAAWAGGSLFPVPKRDRQRELYERVMQAKRDGKVTVAQIAREEGLSERQVYRILRLSRAS